MGLKDLKKNFLVESATTLFLSEGIEKVTIKDIATHAGVGEMTIYRYFGKKQAIVTEAVIKLQGIVSKNYFKLVEGKTGFDKLSIFYNSYLQVFIDRPNYFQFIREFDLCMSKEESSSLQRYEDELNIFKHSYIEAYELGLKDGSVKEVEDIELFYFTTTHALIELCKKLAISRGVLPQDERIEKVKEIGCLISTFLKVFKNS